MRWPTHRPATVTEVVEDEHVQRLYALARQDLHLQQVASYEPYPPFVCTICGCVIAIEFLTRHRVQCRVW